MSNPSNLLRPPVLNNSNNAEQQAQPARALSLAELTPMIAEIASQLVQQQVPQLIQSALNPDANSNSVRDQAIGEEHRNNLQDLDKVPDVVKCLREFSGNQGEFNSWRKSVERILKIYDHTKGTPKYYGILSIIRNKIVGNADIALESYNTPLDWAAISKCLSLHYADKRDMATLEYQMNSLVQGRSSVQDFYQLVYKHLSLILNKLGCIEASNDSLVLLTKVYRDKALDTFVRGLNGDLPKLLGMKEPADLPQALHLCLKLENQNYRANYAQSNIGSRAFTTQSHPPPLPQRSYPNFQQSQVNPRSQQRTYNQNQATFYPQLAYMPQAPFIPSRNNNHQLTQPSYNNNNNSFLNNQFQPPRPLHPKPQPRPEPMEVDESLRTRRVDYMNRPRPNNLNRPPPTINQPQRKIQRAFYLEDEAAAYTAAIEQEDGQCDQTLEDYLETAQEPKNDTLQFSDINFLV